jgi:hypothetical protein
LAIGEAFGWRSVATFFTGLGFGFSIGFGGTGTASIFFSGSIFSTIRTFTGFDFSKVVADLDVT